MVSQITNLFSLTPQILKNINYQTDNKNPLENPKIQQFIAQKQHEIGKKGRVFVRKSGTENLIRIMAEGNDNKLVDNIVKDIANKITSKNQRGRGTVKWYFVPARLQVSHPHHLHPHPHPYQEQRNKLPKKQQKKH